MWFIVFHDVVKEDNLAAVKVVVDESPFFLFLSYFFSVLSCFISISFFAHAAAAVTTAELKKKKR